MLRDGAKLADATQRVVMFFPRAGMPIDVSDERVQRARATRNASVTGASGRGDQTSQTSVTIRGRSLDVSCSLNENLLPAELAQLVNEHLASAAWDSVETAFRKPLRVSGAPRRESASGRVAEVFGARVAINCGGGDLRAASRSDSQAELFKVGPTSMECGDEPQWMETWTVTATFYSHDELFCLVFGKCVRDWGLDDSWWGQGDIVVDEATMSWEEWIGYEPPTPACDPTTTVDTLCMKVLSDSNQLAITFARTQVRPDSEFTDSTIKAMCLAVRNKFSELYDGTPRKVWEGVNVPGDGHSGAELGGNIHIDRDFLSYTRADIANRGAMLYAAALHEAAHVLYPNQNHADGLEPHEYPYPYNYISQANTPNSCAKSIY